MANGITHSIVGGLCGLGVALFEQNNQSPINPVLEIGVGLAFGNLPDTLEPAIHPHHRQFCHSVVVLAAVGYGIKKSYEWKPQGSAGKFWRALALCAGVGYISHLILDVVTPRSLPLLGKV
jgi:membrane-bound metal-dependent hydrolase YbcI (DUF457 family)